MQVKIQKFVFTHPSYKYTDKNGKEHPTSFYKLVLEEGYSIMFKPVNNNDYPILNAISEVVFKDTPKKDK